jgi:hypothetical protein
MPTPAKRAMWRRNTAKSSINSARIWKKRAGRVDAANYRAIPVEPLPRLMGIVESGEDF